MYWFNNDYFFCLLSPFGSVIKILKSLNWKWASDSKMDPFVCGV